jgi:hypothetical protein
MDRPEDPVAVDRGHHGENALTSYANSCPNVTITVTQAY